MTSGPSANSGSLSASPVDESKMQPLEPMDPGLTWDQPGSGVIVHGELAWGRIRRWWLRTFRKSYVERMRSLRHGDVNRLPHDVLDPRDIKFFRNRGGYYWQESDDPFAGRDQWPFARAGLAELFVFSAMTFGPAAVLATLNLKNAFSPALTWFLWLVILALVVIGGLIVWFFRNPHREIPSGPGTIVSPADGVIAAIEEIEHDEFIGGPAVLVGIFLSIFNVHINRAPLAGRVIGLSYRKGKYLNALRPESAKENEQLEVRMQETQQPWRRFRVRQITGAIARRIVCWLRPGDELQAGEQFGMIKLGSRTEVVLPREAGLEIQVKIGEAVKAGSSVVAVYR